MSYFDEDDNDFYEPSEFDEKVDDLKSTLKQSVKKEFLDRMESLEKENAELQSIKQRMHVIEWEHKEAQAKARKERLIELFGENMVTAWGVNGVGKQRPKCDQCDVNRRINFKSPQGNDCSEYCECSTRDYIYEPEEYKLVKFSEINRYETRYYKYYANERDSTEEYVETSNIYKDGNPFDKLNSYRIVFLDKETCQKYCDWKNKVPD